MNEEFIESRIAEQERTAYMHGTDIYAILYVKQKHIDCLVKNFPKENFTCSSDPISIQKEIDEKKETLKLVQHALETSEKRIKDNEQIIKQAMAVDVLRERGWFK